MSKNMKYIEFRKSVYNHSKGRCSICGKPINIEEMTIDHIIPLSRGGDGSFSNVQATCYSCNLMKHNLTNDEFMRKLWKVTIHNLGNIFATYTKV